MCRLLEISEKGAADLALPECPNVQADDAVHVYVVSQLREHLK
jgi:hypothetical protein